MNSIDNVVTAKILHWIARLSGIAALVPLMLIVFGEPGSGPSGAREWAYLAFFPFGFGAGYLIGWRWPLTGGSINLACIAVSLAICGRTFGLGPYLIWATLCIPAVLFIIAGSMQRRVGDRRHFAPAEAPQPVARRLRQLSGS